jgi:endoglucanase
MRSAIRIIRCLSFISLLLALTGWRTPDADVNCDPPDLTTPFRRNLNIGRGINFGNALEAPVEGQWGMIIQESHVQAIADAGFNSVRLPICWSAHTSSTSPYSIDPAFLDRVDEVMNWCLSRNLAVIITIHHFNDLYDYPDNPVYLNMFYSIWKQLTARYLAVDHERLFFEVLNEPHNNLTPEKWNQLMPKIIDTIRARDNDRTLIIDCPEYANHTFLPKLNIPETEQNVIVSTRYYLPWQFAQQGAWWSDWTDLMQYLGTRWTGTESEKNAVLDDISFINNWAAVNGRPITIGEWGSIMFADNQSRLTWTNYVRTQFENNDFSWSYFDFGVVFKSYSIAENRWLTGFTEALLGNSETVSDGRVSDSLGISPAEATRNDSITVRSYIKISNDCSKTDSVKVKVVGSVIKVTAYHTEQIPGGGSVSQCADSIKIGKLAAGVYSLIFESDYLDVVNSIHFSVIDTTEITISQQTSVDDNASSLSRVYPVPASHTLIVDNAEGSNHYLIYNLQGQVLCRGTDINEGINVSGLRSGEYILRIMEDKSTVLNRRIIVVH